MAGIVRIQQVSENVSRGPHIVSIFFLSFLTITEKRTVPHDYESKRLLHGAIKYMSSKNVDKNLVIYSGRRKIMMEILSTRNSYVFL